MVKIISMTNKQIQIALTTWPVNGLFFKDALGQATAAQLESALQSLVSEEFPHGEPGHKGRVHLIRKRINKLSTQ